MAANEHSIILSKNKGNAQSAPNTQSHIHINGGPRRTGSRRALGIPHHTPAAAIDLPQRPAPVYDHAYPPTRYDTEITPGNDSRCRPAVGNPVYSGGVHNRSDAVGALPYTILPLS